LNKTIFNTVILVLIWGICLAQGQEEGFELIFNGEDLTGWEGSPAFWSVKEGSITGETTEGNPIPYNQFLIWDGGILENFELRMEVRLSGENNSGIQYRSRHLEEAGDFVVGGYQVDIHPRTEYNGMLYEEKGRGIIAQQGQKVIIDPNGLKWLVGNVGPLVKTDLNQWNEYSVIARGNHLIHKLNGNVTVEVIDHQSSARSLEGVLALQVHQGASMLVQFRNIRLKRFSDAPILEVSDAPVPEDAVRIP